MSAKAIRAHNTTWQEFSSSVWKDELDSFSLIMREQSPPSSRSYIQYIRSSTDVSIEVYNKEIAYFSEFKKRVLLPGGYLVHLLQFYANNEW